MDIHRQHKLSVSAAVFIGLSIFSQLGFSQAQQYMLDNGVLRFGGQGQATTSYNTAPSIVPSGMLQQPFYRSSDGNWYKLTFSTDLPLSMTIGTGSGSVQWTGSTVPSTGAFNASIGLSTLGSLSVVPEDFTTTRTVGDVVAGFGTLVVAGEVEVNGQTMGVRHTYSLGEEDAFIRVTTRITNLDESVIENVNLWVGTRDDWVGETDRPRKIRGNIGDGAFAPINAAGDASSALRVESDDEAVLFYSTTPNVNTVWASCCSFINSYNQDPALTLPESPFGDGSYAIHLPFGDLEPSASRDLVWIYAAGTLADIDDIISDVAAAASSVSNITDVSAQLSITSSETGSAFWVTVPAGSAAPTAEQIEAGSDYAGVSVVTSGSVAVSANQATPVQLAPLSPATQYTVYTVVTTVDGEATLYSDIQSQSFSTQSPLPAVGESQVDADLTSADVGEEVTVTVTVRNSTGLPVSGLAISLNASPADGVVITQPNPVSTDANGVASFSVTSEVAQTVRLTASFNPDIGFVDVTWRDSSAAGSPVAVPAMNTYALAILSVLLILMSYRRLRFFN